LEIGAQFSPFRPVAMLFFCLIPLFSLSWPSFQLPGQGIYPVVITAGLGEWPFRDFFFAFFIFLNVFLFFLSSFGEF